MTTDQSHFENPTGTIESMSATQPVAKRPGSPAALTAGARLRAVAVLHRLMRAAGAKRVNPSDTRVVLLNTKFRGRIAALAQQLTAPATALPGARQTLAPRRQLTPVPRAVAVANTSGTSRDHEG